MRFTVRRLRIAAIVTAAACGGGGDSAPDGGTDRIYASPDDFDRAGCGDGSGFEKLDPTGIWHMELAYPDRSPIAGTVRVDATGDDLSGMLLGDEVDEVRHTSTDLFLRRAYEDRDGRARVRAWDACTAREDGSVFGRFASCIDGDCALARFEAFPVAPLDEPTSAGMTVISRHAGPEDAPWPMNPDDSRITVDVAYGDGLAYVARHGDGLRIVDVAEPGKPRDVGHAPVMYPDEEIYNDVHIVNADAGRYALVASNVRGAVALDVTDPAAPEEVAAFPRPAEGEPTVDVHSLFVDGTRAYLANLSRAGVGIFDVADPTNPERLGGYVDPGVSGRGGFVHDLYVADGRAYLNYWNLGLVVVDTRDDPQNPSVVGRLDGYDRPTSHASWVTAAGDRRVAVHGDEGFGAHVRTVDVDPASPGFLDVLGTYQTRPQVSVHNLVAAGTLAYVTYYQDGLRVLDLSDPGNPTKIAHHHTWPGAGPGYGRSLYEGAIDVDLDAERNHVYVADTHRGLVILRLDVRTGGARPL